MKLGQQTLSATFWSGTDLLVRFGLQTLCSIILARFLTPEEFGTVALLYLFTGIAGVFVDGGFAVTLIQRQDVDHTDESTVFWINISVGFAVTLAIWFLAPVLADFYQQPQLDLLAKFMSISVFANALGSIHGTLLTKALNFRLQMKIGFAANLAASIIAVAAAMQGYGIWALALQTIIASSVTSALLWLFNDWRPKLEFSLESARKLYKFGSYIFASTLLETLYSRIYTLLIGKFFGVRDLGFYARAETTQQMPTTFVSGILARIALPLFSRVAADRDLLSSRVKLALRISMLINAPLMLGLIAVAEPFMQTVFGRQWLPAVPLLQVLCIGAAIWPLHVINLHALLSQGHSHLFFRLEILKKIVGITLLGFASFYGVMGIALSQTAFGLMAFFMNAYYTGRLIGYGYADQIRDCLPIILLSLLMAIAVYGMKAALELSAATELLILVPSGIFIFAALCKLAKIGEIPLLFDLIKNRLSSGK